MSSGQNRSLRRSARAPKKIAKQISEFSVGDLVEVQRNGEIVRARLTQLLTEGSSPNPRWLIRFESANYHNKKDEEVYEHTFVGKIMDGTKKTSRTISPSNTHHQQRKGSRGNSPEQQHSLPPALKEEQPATNQGSNKADAESNAAVVKEEEDDTTESESSSRNNASSARESPTLSTDSLNMARRGRRTGVSTRESRSRKRQALSQEDEQPSKEDETLLYPSQQQISSSAEPSLLLSVSNQNAKSGMNGNNHSNKRKMMKQLSKASSHHHSNNNGSNNKRAKEEDCVKVKLLTGTLYLYRGPHRRAEFVRRV